MMNQANILMIVTDQQALHAVSCYGAPVCQTPHIDVLAQDGIRFTRAYTPCALCTAARASILTGLYPHHHGAMFNTKTLSPFDEDRIGAGLEMYPHRLREQGYNLGYSGKWHAGIARTANDVGFDGYGPRDYGDVWASNEYAADPAEFKNLINDAAEIRAEMRTRLRNNLLETEDTLGPQWPYILSRPLQA